MICQGCGKRDDAEGETVRQCCTWEGNQTLCPKCYMDPEKRTPGHTCGIGITTKGEGNGQDQ